MRSLVLVMGMLGCTVGGTSYDELVQAGSGSGSDGGGSDAPVTPDATGSDAGLPDGGGSGSDAGTGSDGGIADGSVDAMLDAWPHDYDASLIDGATDARGPGIDDDGRKLQTTFYACSTGSAGTGAVAAVVVVLGLALVRRRRVTAT